MKLLPLVFLGLTVPAIASAQAMPSPQGNPCTEAGGMVMGGVSVNEMKCKYGLALQELGSQVATAADRYDTLLAQSMALQARIPRMEADKKMALWEERAYWARWVGLPEPPKPEDGQRQASMGGIPAVLNTPTPVPPKVPPQPAPPVIHAPLPQPKK